MIFLGILIIVFALCLIMMYRNNLIYKYRIRKLGEVSASAQKLIEKREDDFLEPYRDFENSASYNKMIFQLHKWSYRSFYK